METFSTWLAPFEGNPSVISGFAVGRRHFDVFFVVNLNELFNGEWCCRCLTMHDIPVLFLVKSNECNVSLRYLWVGCKCVRADVVVRLSHVCAVCDFRLTMFMLRVYACSSVTHYVILPTDFMFTQLCLQSNDVHWPDRYSQYLCVHRTICCVLKQRVTVSVCGCLDHP